MFFQSFLVFCVFLVQKSAVQYGSRERLALLAWPAWPALPETRKYGTSEGRLLVDSSRGFGAKVCSWRRTKTRVERQRGRDAGWQCVIAKEDLCVRRQYGYSEVQHLAVGLGLSWGWGTGVCSGCGCNEGPMSMSMSPRLPASLIYLLISHNISQDKGILQNLGFATESRAVQKR